MKLTIALFLSAACMVVTEQRDNVEKSLVLETEAQSCTLDTFVEDASWTTTNDLRSPAAFPRKEAAEALAKDERNAKELRIRKVDTSVQPRDLENASPADARDARSVHLGYCPYRYRYIWYYNRCWVLWPRLRYAYSRARSCTHCSHARGYCRPDCFFTYNYILGLCRNRWGMWYLRRLPALRLPQYWDCRRRC